MGTINKKGEYELSEEELKKREENLAISDEEAAAIGAKSDGSTLSWWTPEEEEAAKKEANSKGDMTFGTYKGPSSVSLQPRQYYEEEPKKETANPESKSTNATYGHSNGTYGVLKNEDFTEYRKKRSEQIARQKAAIIAGERAAQAEQARLLATGMYFSDGRGNIKLKKEYRKQGGKGGRGYYDKDTEHNTYAGMTEMAINKARQTAYDAAMEGYDGFEGALRRQEEEKAAKGRAKTQEIVEQNGFELAQQEERKKQRGINLSKGHLAIFDGLVAAYKALDSKYNVRATHRDERRVGQLKDKNGRIIGYGAIDKKQVYADNDGIRVQNGEDGKPTVLNGFVGIGTIDTINRKLRETGNNKFKITGIIARQKIDAIGNKAEPMFYVQGIRADGTQFGKTMSMKDVYNFGKENYIGSGENDENAENNVIDTFSDVFGVRKRQEEAKMRDPRYRKSLADAKKAEEEAKILEYEAAHPETAATSDRIQVAKINAASRENVARINNQGKKASPDRIKEIDQELAAYSKILNGNLDYSNRDKIQQRVSELTDELIGGKAPVKSGDNTIDVSKVESKEELNQVLNNAAEGATVTLGGVTKIKRNGKWVVMSSK
jgi:hypothetical protein